MRSSAASSRSAVRPRRASARASARPNRQKLRRARRRNPAPPETMELRNRSVALYGRFSAGTRERLQREITHLGGVVVRDLTRRSDVFVVGALATALIDSGSLAARIKLAKERCVPVMGERPFAAMLGGETM